MWAHVGLEWCVMVTTEKQESTNDERSVMAVAGSAVKLDCKFDDVDCRNRSIRWLHYRPSSDTPVYWRRGDKIHPSLESTNVSFEDNQTRGRSVLTIPRVRFEDHGRFECLVGGVEQCRMNFRLLVTGKYLSTVIMSTSAGVKITRDGLQSTMTVKGRNPCTRRTSW